MTKDHISKLRKWGTRCISKEKMNAYSELISTHSVGRLRRSLTKGHNNIDYTRNNITIILQLATTIPTLTPPDFYTVSV